jgi:hypothetical protein
VKTFLGNLYAYDLPLIVVINIIERERKITCTQEIYKAKLERLNSTRLTRRDQVVTL